LTEEDNNSDINISNNNFNSNEVPKFGENKAYKPKISFSEQWEKVDKLCPHCGNIAERAEDINRQNMKRLFSLKMNFNDIMTFLLVAMLLLSVYRYYNDTAQCKEFLASGTQSTWNELMNTGIPIESLLATAKSKTALNPLLLSDGSKTTNLTVSGGT
jgi:hypothetical protein